MQPRAATLQSQLIAINNITILQIFMQVAFYATWTTRFRIAMNR
jgi:hypothetical protein